MSNAGLVSTLFLKLNDFSFHIFLRSDLPFSSVRCRFRPCFSNHYFHMSIFLRYTSRCGLYCSAPDPLRYLVGPWFMHAIPRIGNTGAVENGDV
jgi:hypothetical protein